MFEKIKNVFINPKNIINNNDNGLIQSLDPFVLNQGVKFSRDEKYHIFDIKEELLDPKLSKEEVFKIYWNVCKNQDAITFESLNLKANLFVINPLIIGREYSKTVSFNTSYKGESKESLFEIIDGDGYFIIENNFDEKKITIVKVSKGNKVLIPKTSSFTIVNSSSNKKLVCLCLMGKNTLFEKKVLKKFNGQGIYYTEEGFVKNKNYDFLYKLENLEGDYIFDNSFDTEKNLYEEFIVFPEKFIFLK